jgi:hypothetical protein
MRVVHLAVGVVSVGVVSASVVALMACNAVLGIDKAQLALPEAGAHDAGLTRDADLNCENYCSLVAAECTGRAAEYIPGSPEVCQSLCPHFKSVSYGTVDDTAVISLAEADDPSQFDASADSLNCRLWHVNFAITTQMPILHCPHAGPLGGEKCGGDPCAKFCELEMAACKDVPQYDSGADCLNACRPDAGYPGFPYLVGAEGGVGTVTAGNTLDCRMYHTEAALKKDPNEGPSFHCPHTGNPSLNKDGTSGPCQ